MLFVGIDPGLTGAIAILDSAKGEVRFKDAPVLSMMVGKSVKNIMDARGAASCLAEFQGRAVHVVLEKVGAMPRMAGGKVESSMGATSAFNFGMGFGIWQGILAALSLRHEIVHPATWKKAMMRDMEKDKDASRVKAMQLFPQVSEALKLKKHHGRADALLMAEFGRRTYTAKNNS